MHKKTLLATLIFGLLAGQAVAAPYLPLATDHRNGQEQTASNAWLEVDLGAFEHNIQTLKDRLGDKGPQICAIMKADAYGHGIDLLVPSVVKANIPCIGIASNEEARVAREKGFTGRLMRVRAATPDEVEQALPYKMEELIGSLVSAQGIADIAQRHHTNIPVHIGLNSAGMSRNGIDLRLADAKQDALAMLKLKGITPVGIMTHFPVEEKEDVKLGLAQFKLDSQWLIEAGKLDRSKLTIHAANSFATLEVPEAYFDMVRPGGLIYGDSMNPKRIKDISVAISEAQNEAIGRHNKALEVERKRAAASFESRGRQQQVAQGIKHEIAQDVGRTCEWREPHRVRIERLYGAYGHNPDGSTTGVSNPLPASPFDGTAKGAVGGGGVRLGR